MPTKGPIMDTKQSSDLLALARREGLHFQIRTVENLVITGPAEIRARYLDLVRAQKPALLRILRAEAAGRGPLCCPRGPNACDHVWCSTCDDWARDTGTGPSCHPRREMVA